MSLLVDYTQLRKESKTEKKTKKRLKKKKNNRAEYLRTVGQLKMCNICLMGISKRKKGTEEIF